MDKKVYADTLNQWLSKNSHTTANNSTSDVWDQSALSTTANVWDQSALSTTANVWGQQELSQSV